MAKREMYNSTSTPVAIDAEGHLLPGRSRATVADSEEVARAEAAGILIDVKAATKASAAQEKTRGQADPGDSTDQGEEQT